MSDQLDFGDGTWAQAAPLIRTVLEQFERTLNGNGRPGLKTEVAELKTEVAEIKAIASASLVWVKGIGVALGIAIAAAGLYVAYLQLSHRISQVDIPHAKTEQPRHADSGIPSMIAAEMKGH